jgi:hypothetical protein
MISEDIEEVKATEVESNGRTCSEVYSCVEDMFYFINLAIPFIS